MTNRIGILAPLFLTLGFTACQKEPCDEEIRCKTLEPEDGKVIIKVTPPDSGTVPVTLYSGYYEENREKFTRQMDLEENGVILEVEKRYSAAATYVEGEDTTVVVDGGRLPLRDFINCDKVCYEVENLILDLRKAD